MKRSVLIQPISLHALVESNRRRAERHATQMEALTRPVDANDTLWWGATVQDISSTGIGIRLCFPFKPGTYLAMDLKAPEGLNRTILSRVVHVRDQADGTWQLGCEFVKALNDDELQTLI